MKDSDFEHLVAGDGCVAVPQSTNVGKPDHARGVGLGDVEDAQQPGELDLGTDLLDALACGGRGRVLVGVDEAAGKAPQPVTRLDSAATQHYAAVRLDHYCGRDFGISPEDEAVPRAGFDLPSLDDLRHQWRAAVDAEMSQRRPLSMLHTGGSTDCRTAVGGYTRADLEPLSFDDLPLGGEWTTRRRTISESDIALYAGVAGDFSPLTIEAAHGPRAAPPALVVAMAIGLGTMDMPVPSVAEWEWLNWRFPRPVHAGDTIFARWTLTQKRPPARDAVSSIVVWRVDVHKLDGTICAEGEVGAKIKRHPAAASRPAAKDADVTSPGAPASGSRRRRRRRTGPNGNTPEAVAAPVAPVVQQPKTGTQPPLAAKRRRRRRSPATTSGGKNDGAGTAGADSPTTTAAAAASAPAHEPLTSAPAHVAVAATQKNPLGRVISRLRRS